MTTITRAHTTHVRTLHTASGPYFSAFCGCGWTGLAWLARRDASREAETHGRGRL